MKKSRMLLAVMCAAMLLSGCQGKQPAADTAAETGAETKAAEASAEAETEESGGAAETEGEVLAKLEDGYPNDTITLICDAKAGSDVDVISRKFAVIAEKYADVKFLVENTPGGSGVMAVTSLLQKKPDGYAMMLHSISLPITIGTGQAPYSVDDVAPLAGLFDDCCVVSVKADSPFETFEDVMEYAKENPGQLNWGAAKVKASMHVLTLKIAKAAGVDVNYIAYDDATAAKVALLGGNVSVICSTPDNVREDFKNGDIRILASTQEERSEEFADVPTFRELGYDDLTNYSIYRGLFVKPGIDEARMAYLDELVKRVEEDPEWVSFVTETLNKNIRYMDREDYTADFKNFVEFTKELTKDIQ